ncbi:uncharacterized protein LOC129720886 [Wyeomyia smithii]|uniref:uncharacterized protein LOC129720886 n=1 Tax=Wyeomyia smithii TaxID=174621 RepID=UPI002467B96B|nr:uncharacterized protein LOC129720886 [Wyeomyia smithii]
MRSGRTSIIAAVCLIFAVTAKGGDLPFETQFIWDFFKASFDERHNLITAPFMVRMGMTLMTSAVNDRYTQRQLRSKLHLQDSVTKTSESYRRQLAALSRSDNIRFGTKVITIGTDEFNPAFLAGTRYFNASIEKYPHLNATFVSGVANRWVEQVTSGMVRRVLLPRELHSNIRLLLLNAVAFQGKWKYAFDVDKTRVEQFHTGDEANRYHTEMMNLPDNFLKTGLYEPLKATGLVLPFKDESDLSLLVIMPQQQNGNLTQMVKGLNQSSFVALLGDMQSEKVQVKLPRFSFSNHLNVNAIFRNLHLNAPFEWSVFQVFKKSRLVLDRVKHGVSIEFQERGVRAAAASGFSVTTRSVPQIFFANRPFVYVIFKRSTHFPLFLGSFVHPLGSSSSSFFKHVNNS